MLIVVAAALLLVAAIVALRARRRAEPELARETTPALDAWIADTLELELAESVLGMRASTPEERRSLARSLRGDPDPELVSRVEDAVRAVELEFVRYAHESDAEANLRVRYEDGRTTTKTKRLAWADVPDGIRADFDRRGGTRVFRTWPFPWSRARAL